MERLSIRRSNIMLEFMMASLPPAPSAHLSAIIHHTEQLGHYGAIRPRQRVANAGNNIPCINSECWEMGGGYARSMVAQFAGLVTL